MTLPRGYAGPHDPSRDPSRDPTQVMSDGAAQNLIVQIIELHEAMYAQLQHYRYLAALGPGESAGPITGSGDYDRMEARAGAILEAEREWERQRKNALQALRRIIETYEIRLGLRRPPEPEQLQRPRVESIDYRNGNGQRRVG